MSKVCIFSYIFRHLPHIDNNKGLAGTAIAHPPQPPPPPHPQPPPHPHCDISIGDAATEHAHPQQHRFSLSALSSSVIFATSTPSNSPLQLQSVELCSPWQSVAFSVQFKSMFPVSPQPYPPHPHPPHPEQDSSVMLKFGSEELCPG